MTEEKKTREEKQNKDGIWRIKVFKVSSMKHSSSFRILNLFFFLAATLLGPCTLAQKNFNQQQHNGEILLQTVADRKIKSGTCFED